MEEFETATTRALPKIWYLDENENGTFEYELYADYRDEIAAETVTKICESDDPEVQLYEWVEEGYAWSRNEAMADIRSEVVKILEQEFGRKNNELDGWVDESLDDFLLEMIEFKLPVDHYIEQKVQADIFVDTGDANYDFVLNCRYPAWDGASEGEIDPKASIRWLAETQGYTEPELRVALEEGDLADPKTFLESLRVELANTPSHIMALVFLAEMTVGDLIKLNVRMKKQAVDGHRAYDATERPDCGTIHISKRAETGLYDCWNGGGGPFEIILEKDLDLPLKFIHSALPDGGQGRWSISDTYGMCGSAWRDVVSNVNDKEET